MARSSKADCADLTSQGDFFAVPYNSTNMPSVGVVRLFERDLTVRVELSELEPQGHGSACSNIVSRWQT